MKTTIKRLALTLGGLTVAASPALAQDNSRYGETRINQLPDKGKSAHALWVGSWWAYKRNGIAYRHKSSFAECRGVDLSVDPNKLVTDNKAFCLSAAEKIDYLEGRLANVEWDDIQAYHRVAQDELGAKQERIRELVRLLNRWIEENAGRDWRETDNGKEYLRLNEELEAAKANLPQIDVDTTTEFENIEHGLGVPGVGGWWGHCNAWSAAAIMEEEPVNRGTVTFQGRTVEFTPGEAKALLTESWMEHRSSFYGSRHDDPENTGLSYEDVTPAAFHIFFGSQLGIRQKSFVIDRYTGDQVWNQPMRSYAWSIEKLYEGAQSESIELFQTTYDASGKAKKTSLGNRDVFPVEVTAHIHWMTDGLPHEEVTRANITADAYPTNSSDLHNLWGNQVEMRTLTYTLYLDRPLEDPAARIVGDGAWSAGLAGSNNAQPDFMWQPLNQGPSVRRYENPYVDTEFVQAHVLPATVAVVEEPVSNALTSKDTPIAVPDNNPTGISSTIPVELSGRLSSVAINVDITHTYIGDLTVNLVKGNQTISLHNRTGGSADNIVRTFDAPALIGAAAAGDWTLKVIDLAGQDVGTLNRWSLDLVTDAGEPVEEPVDDVQHRVYEDDGLPLNIPDNDAAGVSTDIYVGQSGTLQKLDVTVEIEHTYIGDLIVTLEKTGQIYKLHNREGGSTDNLAKTWSLDAAQGTSLRGKWILKVVDGAGQDVGKITRFALDATWR